MALPPLYQHQQDTIRLFSDLERTFDASDPGTGKTRVVIEIVRRRILKTGKSVLIVAPKSLLKSAWANDFKKFAPEVSLSIARAENHKKAFAVLADVYITNHDGVNRLVKEPLALFKRFDTLVIDESGAFKHHTARRSKNMAKMAKLFKYVHLMNGTPSPNTILDIWHQMYVLDGGQRLGRSYFAFRNAVCQPEQVGPMPNMLRWRDKPGAEGAVADLIKDIVVRHKLEDCLDLPENHRYTMMYELPPKQMQQYKTMQAAAILPLKNATVQAINASAVSKKLLQIASGAVYEDADTYHLLDTGRYELVLDLVDERDHSLVFFNWRHQRDQLVACAQSRGYSFAVLDGETPAGEREQIVTAFELGLYKVLFAHPQTAAHGLTLVRATRTIWASPTYNLEHFIQGNRRIHRAGQTQRTETITVLATGTLDVKAYAALEDKNIRMEDLLLELEAA
jgi:SNF2 family DNA or RNA helicase